VKSLSVMAAFAFVLALDPSAAYQMAALKECSQSSFLWITGRISTGADSN
jgi:hypothetical protein